MDPSRGSKRSSISFGSYQRQPGQNNYISSPYETSGGSLLSNNNGNGSSSASGNTAYYTSRSPMYSPLDYSHPMFSPNGYSQLHQFRNSNSLGIPSVCEYEAHYPLFGVDWSVDDYVCLGSYKEGGMNRLQVIKSPDLLTWDKVAECNVTFPVSTMQWQPAKAHPRKFATCSDSLRIWMVKEDESSIQEEINLSLCKYNKQQNSNTKNADVTSHVDKEQSNNLQTSLLGELPPITSFHWNPIDPNLLISSSIDTTCIVWDLQSSNYVRTQLIAHDSEVFDVRFLTQSTQLFASCGGDGSVRVFDLRCLAHSTIIYEPNVPAANTSDTLAAASVPNRDVTDTESSVDSLALLRLEPSPFDPNVIATFALDSNSILILDMRNPGSPILTLEAHTASVNQIKWHPIKKNVLLSCSDDCQVLYWDLNSSLSPPSIDAVKTFTSGNTDPTGATNDQVDPAVSKWNAKNILHKLDKPKMFYVNKGQEVNNIVWRPQGGEWFGSIGAKRFQNVRI